MKKFFLILCIATTLISCGTKRCNIEGAIANFNGEGSVCLIDMWNNRAIIDSVAMFDGCRFHFKHIKSEPTFAQIIMSSGRPISYVFVEGGTIRVAGDIKESDVVAVGTPANDAFNDMMSRSQGYMADYRNAVSVGDKAKIAQIESEFDAMQRECLEKNMDNVFGLFMLKQLSYSEPSGKIIELLGKLSKTLQALPVAVDMKASAERKFKTEPQAEGSDYVPYYINIEQPTLEEVSVSLKSVVENKANRYVLLDFWASWCGPCMGEMPHLKEAYKLYHEKGFEIYGVSLDSKYQAWKSAVEKQQMKWINVSTLDNFNNSAAQDYAVESIPTNYLIDCSNGVIIAKNLRGEAVLEKLAELFK